MAILKDRVKQGLSPSTVVEDMDCRYVKNLDIKNTRTVIVPEMYLKMIEKDSYIFEILEASDDPAVQAMVAEARAEYQADQVEVEGYEYHI
tara:strand:- start:2849 stop:3121 length:273 start_codon:yes stop_codon:yes gene_type:complete